MSTTLRERPTAPAPSSGAKNGGMPARRAVTRWAWRLFRREWRQQMLVLALITVAVAATLIGAAVSTNTPPPASAGFGTARDMATFQAPDPHLASQIGALRQKFGRIDVIENQTFAIPGTINTYQLRAQNPHGPYGQPMLSLVSGHFPAGPGQVAVTSGVASDFGLRIGSVWHQGGTARTVVGIVQNPQSLLDEFALVAPGQVHNPTQVTVLFDGNGQPPAGLAHDITAAGSRTPANVVNPDTISTAGLVVGMLLIALVAVGGFTVLAQRRLRSLGMLASTGATDRHVRLVVLANGAVVGVAGAILGLVLGMAGWLAYRPALEQNAHHLIGMFALPWGVIGLALLLAVVAAVFAAWLPARAITKVPIVTALSGRPAPPKQVRRSAIPGLVLLVIAFILFGLSGSSANSNGGLQKLALGLVVLMVAVILLAPFCLSVVARLGNRSPISVRLALRDLSRYRARSGSALAAISIGILIAVIISVTAAARYGNVLDYAGPNLASNQLIVYTPNGQGGGPNGPVNVTPAQLQSMAAKAHAIATDLGSRDVVELETTDANLNHNGGGRNWNGPLYVATPQLLHAFGISPSQVSPTADILTMRPGLSGLSGIQLNYGSAKGPGPSSPGPGQNPTSFPCPRYACVANPPIQEVSALPSGTSAPNTVITEHAIRTLHLQTGPGSVAGWLIQATNPLTSAQIHNAQVAAAAANMSVETRSSVPTSATIIDWATVFGIVLALAILAMSVGLIRSETASDLRTLTATGASGRTRRNITAATAGALGFTGAVLGTVGGYIGTAGWFRTNSLNGGLTAIFTTVPVTNLLIILIGMPLVAAIGGWIFAGRQPRDLGHQPLE
ncbi:MAG TPA: FtsX-like permease family protein [Streptosporangiaceae bacterium]|nr:FtsX-like permease family protein [Streptosporangiaceae bacterium]